MKQLLFAFFFIFCQIQIVGQNGYNLWLDYKKLDGKIIANEYSFISSIYLQNDNNDEILNTTKNILTDNLSTLLGKKIISEKSQKTDQITLTINTNAVDINDEGFYITSTSYGLKIEAKLTKDYYMVRIA